MQGPRRAGAEASAQQHSAFRVKCHSGLGSRTNMHSAMPAPDASSTLLGGNKCHCLTHGLGTGGSEPKTYTTGTDSDLKALSPFLGRPGVLSASNFSNTGSSPRHRALGSRGGRHRTGC